MGKPVLRQGPLCVRFSSRFLKPRCVTHGFPDVVTEVRTHSRRRMNRASSIGTSSLHAVFLAVGLRVS